MSKSIANYAGDLYSQVKSNEATRKDYFTDVKLKSTRRRIYKDGAEAFELKKVRDCPDPDVRKRLLATIDAWLAAEVLVEFDPELNVDKEVKK